MHYGSVFISNQKSSASTESGELIHKVVEEDLFEWVSTELSEGINFSYKVLIFELILCVPFNSIVESLGDR
jgi:hypothetical protein